MKYSWFELIKYILSFFLGRSKEKEEIKRQEQIKTSEELKNKYDKLDHKKQGENKNDIQDRLHNVFK